MPTAKHKLLSLILGIIASCLGASGAEETTSPPLTNIVQIRQLSRSELEDQPDVRLQAVVTYASPASGMLFVQDTTAGIYVWPKNRPLNLSVGQTVEIVGVAEVGEFSAAVRPDTNGFRVTGEAPLPAAAVFDAPALAEGKWDGQLSRCEGVVQAIDRGAFYWRLSLWTGIHRVYCLVPASEILNPDSLLDATIRVSGVGAATSRQDGPGLSLSLYLTSQKGLEITLAPPADPFALALTPIQEVTRLGPISLGGHRIKISGIVSRTRSNGDFFVEAPQGGVLVRPANPINVGVGERVEVVGFPSVSEPRPNLEQGVMRSLGTGAPSVAASADTPPTVSPAIRPLEVTPSPPVQSSGDSNALWIALVGAAVLAGLGLFLWFNLSRQADLRSDHRRLNNQSTDYAAKLAWAQRAAELERTRATQQALLARLAASPTRTEKGLDAAIQELLLTSLDVLRAKRAGVWLLSANGGVLREAWKRVVGSDDISSLPPVSTTRLQDHLGALRQGSAVSVAELGTDPRTQPNLADFQGDAATESILDAALHRRGSLIGLLRHEHAETPREWTDLEHEFASGIAALIGRLLAEPAASPASAESLQDELTFHRRVADWSTRFLEESSDPSSKTTEEYLEFVARSASAEFAEFGRLTAGDGAVHWQGGVGAIQVAGGASRGAVDWQEDLQRPRREWLWERLLRGEPVLISHLRLLPPEASAEREFLDQRGCRSALYLPISQQGQVVAVMSCSTVEQEHDWPDQLVDRLKTLARILAASPQPTRAALPQSMRTPESTQDV